MLVVEIPLVAAAAARSADGGSALAAVGIGMSILVVVNTPALALTPLVATERDRSGERLLRRYTLAVGLSGTGVLLLLALPPGSAVVHRLFGMDATLGAAVSAFLVGLAPNGLGVALRRYQHGKLIHLRHTGPMVPATVVRLVVTGAIAWTGVGIAPAHGALVAGCALTAGAFVEAVTLYLPARRIVAPPPGPRRTVSGLAVHHAHLSNARLLVMAPTLVTTIAVGHAAQSAESLVVWPVLIQLAALFTSPTTDWDSVTATALRHEPAARRPRLVTSWLAAGISAVFAVVFATGLAGAFIRDLVAVPHGPAELGLRWLWVILPLPALWLVRAYLRGVVMARGMAGWLSTASAAHMVVLLAALTVLIGTTALPGVACAAIALVVGVAAETAATALGTRDGRGTPWRPRPRRLAPPSRQR